MANVKTAGMDALKGAGQDLLKNLEHKALESVNERVSGLTGKLTDVADGGGILSKTVGKTVGKTGEAESGDDNQDDNQDDNEDKGGLKGLFQGVKDKITGGGGGGGGKGSKPTKATNIIESIDVGVPIRTAYNQWTQFGDFPSMMKKVEKADAEEDNKIAWKAQIWWSHREWQSTILEQVPDDRIVWRSSGQKGYVNGAVTFHELAPNMTRILVVLEYHPQGLFERTGNLWRAQGRRARLELKHFRRHVMTQSILNEEELEGWRGVIHDGEVVETHEEHVEKEESEQDQDGQDGSEETDEYDEGAEDESEDEGEPEDEYEESEESEDEGEPEDEYEESEEEPEPEEESDDEGEPEDEYEESEEEPEPDEEPEDEAEEEPEEEETEQSRPRRRRRAS